MSAQIENIKNPLLQEFAEKTQHMSKGDFGRAIYGGVDLEAYAELIVRECCFTGEQYAEGLIDLKHYAFVNKKIKEHFGIKE